MSLHSIRQFHGFDVETLDGAAGRIREALFDDVDWALRYFVVETGEWFGDSEILIPPMAVVRDDWGKRTIYVNLLQDQIRNSPRIDITRPVLRTDEAEFLDHYGYTHYWTRPSAGDAAASSGENAETARLHGTREMIGCAVRTQDNVDGQVEDLRFDDKGWAIEWIVVDPRDWSPGKNVLVSPERVAQMDWENGQIVLAMTRSELEKSPKF